MRMQDAILRAWQKSPLSWRRGFVKSRLAPPLRRLMNSLYPAGPEIFQLAAPLEGYRMRLEWRSPKALVFGTYEPEVAQALLTIVQTDWVVIDVGAHIGYFALLLSKLVGLHGRVIAFEPFPENFRTLEENVRINSCHNIVLENRAVASISGPVTMRSNDLQRLPYTASLVSGQPIADVEAVSLDDYTASLPDPIRFVIMDVEGAEASVLRGMQSMLQRDLPTLLIELHGFDDREARHPALQELHSMNYGFRFIDVPGVQAHILAEPRISRGDQRRAFD